MPTLSAFYGITVRMYYDDHNPPHFHAFYGDRAAKISIDSLEVISGSLPRRAFRLLHEWATLNKLMLLQNWTLAVNHKPLILIEPLE